jgi:hypothetical protein
VENPKAYFGRIFGVFFVRDLPAFSYGAFSKRSHRRSKAEHRSQAVKKEATNLQLDRQELAYGITGARQYAPKWDGRAGRAIEFGHYP